MGMSEKKEFCARIMLSITFSLEVDNDELLCSAVMNMQRPARRK